MNNSLSPSHQGRKTYLHLLLLCLVGDISSASGQVRLDIDLASRKSPRQGKLRRDSFNAVSRVKVLDKGHLVAGS